MSYQLLLKENLYKMNYQTSIEELEQLLSTPEFESKLYPLHTHPHFEKLNDYGDIRTLFDDLVKDLGRLPNQTEYVEAGVKRAESYFRPVKPGQTTKSISWGKPNHKQWADFTWNDPELQKGIRKRLSRAYPSYLVEYTSILQLKQLYPTYYIGTNDWLDTTAGIDIVVASPEHNRVIYIHVTSNSKQSNSTLKQKNTRWGVAIDSKGKRHWYERNFNKGHLHLPFDKFKETQTTRFVNGNPILKPEYLKQVIDMAMMVPDPQHKLFDTWYDTPTNKRVEQLSHLHSFLLDNKVTENGLGQVWV